MIARDVIGGNQVNRVWNTDYAYRAHSPMKKRIVGAVVLTTLCALIMLVW